MEETSTASSPLNGGSHLTSHAPADAMCAACKPDEVRLGEIPHRGIDGHAALAEVVSLLHERAKAAGVDGILVMICIDPATGKPLVRHFSIGDVDGMVTEAAARGQHANVYVQLAILRKELPFGKRGTAADIVAILGLVIDDDGDNDKRALRPFGIQESVLIQTCSKPALNFHPWYLFTRALSRSDGAELAELFNRKCGGDAGTKDIAHVWRVPDTLNFPNAVKLARGRPPRPQRVELVGGSFEAIDPEHLRRSLEAMPDRHPPRINNGNATAHASSGESTAPEKIIAHLPKWVRGLIATANEVGQRSEHCFHTMQVLFEHGLTDDEVRLVGDGAPFAAKYAERGDLNAEIARARTRWVTEGSRRMNECGGHTGEGASGSTRKTSGEVRKSNDGERRTQAQILIGIATREGIELFHTRDGKAFADIPVDGHRETWSLKNLGFRRWIKRAFYEETGGAPNSESMSTAMGVIEGMAHYDGPEREVHLRVANCDGRIYLDLCDPAWRAIEIRSDGWSIVDRPPVRFRRTAGMLQIPDPLTGGDVPQLGGLRDHLHVDDSSFVLLVSWLLAILWGRGPYPILACTGEQGTGKSLTADMLRSLLDPKTAGLRSLPRDTRDLYVAAMNGHVLVFDNLSGIPPEISDCLCRLSTGGGFATRSLYTDDDEVLFDGQRPVALTSITDVADRSDLADRLVIIRLEVIPDEKRRPETELRRAFDAARPRILGALLDVVAHGILNLPNVRLNRSPRMADYAAWIRACETAIWQAGMHLAAYEANRGEAVDIVLDADPVATALRQHMRERSEFRGTCTALLADLTPLVGEHVRRTSWPKSPRGLGGQLTRLAPALRNVGITIERCQEGHAKDRILHIAYKPRE